MDRYATIHLQNIEFDRKLVKKLKERDSAKVFPPEVNGIRLTPEETELSDRIMEIYTRFGVKIDALTGVLSGPRVTRFEFQVAPDTKTSKITKLRDDVSLMLSVPKVRLICPIPGKTAFGIEVPNGAEGTVTFDEVFTSDAFAGSSDPLCVVLGKNLSGGSICLGLSNAPHVLIGGQACSGKTTILKNMIVSLICNTAPSQVKLLLVDSQKRAFDDFKKADHLLEPIIHDPQAAIDSLNRLCEECVRRYQLFQTHLVRNIDAYNQSATQALPKIVVLIDEMAPLTKHNLRDFELAVSRIAQIGRAAGIHIVLATSDLTAKNITGIIKANIPTRIALSTQTPMESRTIMDSCDAECLLLKGDMLLCDIMLNKPQRIQAAYLTKEQIEDKVRAHSNGTSKHR